MKVLLTSVGTDSAISVIRALRLGADKNCAFLVGIDIRDSSPGLYLCDARRLTKPRSSPEHLDQIKALLSEFQIDILWPLSTQDQLYYASQAELLGIPVLTSTKESLEIAINKYRLFQFLNRSDLTEVLPKYSKVESAQHLKQLLPEFGYPGCRVVFKINEGTGAAGLKILDQSVRGEERILSRDNISVSSREFFSWANEVDLWPESHLVEYLPGEEYSVDVLCKNGHVYAGVVRKRSASVYGIATDATVVDEKDVLCAAQKIVEAVGLSYVVNVQFRRDTLGVPKLMEINPRIPGTIGLTIHSGLNFPLLALKIAKNQPITLDECKYGTRILRFFEGVYLP